jgi:hypothetical protein
MTNQSCLGLLFTAGALAFHAQAKKINMLRIIVKFWPSLHFEFYALFSKGELYTELLGLFSNTIIVYR